MPNTDEYEGIIAETTVIEGHNGDTIHAYFARPLGAGPLPAVVLVHHMPGWSDWYKEITRNFAAHGYLTLTPDLYCRAGHGQWADVTAKVRADGGVADDQVVGDAQGAIDFLRALPTSNGRVGVMGSCSGGRHAYLVATRGTGVDAVIDLWGGGVVMKPEDLTEKRPVSPIDYTPDLQCPILGLFGLEDRAPTAEQVDQHEAALKAAGKEYEFHRYEGAGHGFMYHHVPQAYRAAAAVDAWAKVWDFFGRKLGQGGA